MNFTDPLIEYQKCFDYKLYKAFKKALNLCESIFTLSIEHFVLGIYYTEPQFIYNLIGKKIAQEIVALLEKEILETRLHYEAGYSETLLKVLFKAKIISEYNNSLISPEILIVSILSEKNYFSNLLHNISIKPEILIKNLEKQYKFNAILIFILERRELTPIIGREKEINFILESLCSFYSPNILITGKNGIGKTRLIHEVEKLIHKSQNLPERIKNSEILIINPFNYPKKIILEKFQKQKPVIFFIDGLNYLHPETLKEISEIILSSNQNLHIISTSGEKEFYTLVKKYPDIIEKFTILKLKEIRPDETKVILSQTKNYFEQFHKIEIEDTILDKILILLKNNKENISFLSLALKILDKACVKSVIAGQTKINDEDVSSVFSELFLNKVNLLK